MDVHSVIEFCEEKKIISNRLSAYKSRTVRDQETRRLQLLSNQKRKRESTLNAIRNITGLFSDVEENEDEFEEHKEREEDMEWTNSKPKLPRLKNMFMLSEWMVRIPEDLEDKWLFLCCPVGRRCLVRSSKGFTSVYGRKGRQLARFQSGLPNGSQTDYTMSRFSNAEVTILDCIWNAETKSYFILDVVSWKGQLYMDADTTFRSFWIHSKLQEMSWLTERSQRNPFPFVALKYYPSDPITISTVLSKYPYFPSDTPKVDGILFYHKEAYYTPGFSPLVVWLKPFMIPEMFSVVVSGSYLEMKPPGYVDMEDFIKTFEENQRQKEKKPKWRKKKIQSNMETEESVMEVEMQDE